MNSWLVVAVAWSILQKDALGYSRLTDCYVVVSYFFNRKKVGKRCSLIHRIKPGLKIKAQLRAGSRTHLFCRACPPILDEWSTFVSLFIREMVTISRSDWQLIHLLVVERGGN